VRERLPQEMQGEYAAFVKEYLNFSGVFSKSEAELVAMGQHCIC